MSVLSWILQVKPNWRNQLLCSKARLLFRGIQTGFSFIPQITFKKAHLILHLKKKKRGMFYVEGGLQNLYSQFSCFFKEFIGRWQASTTLAYHSFKKTKKSCRISFQKYTLIKYCTCKNSLHFKRLKMLHKVDGIQIAFQHSV